MARKTRTITREDAPAAPTAPTPQDEVRYALREARLPLTTAKLRLGDYDKGLLALLTDHDKIDVLADQLEAGTGWIIQGPPGRALACTQALVKGLVLLNFPVIYYDGLTPDFGLERDDGFIEITDAQVVAVARFYDPSYDQYPFGAGERFTVERRMMKALGHPRAPLIHCTGRFDQCTWYSPELMVMLRDRCKLVTVK